MSQQHPKTIQGGGTRALSTKEQLEAQIEQLEDASDMEATKAAILRRQVRRIRADRLLGVDGA